MMPFSCTLSSFPGPGIKFLIAFKLYNDQRIIRNAICKFRMFQDVLVKFPNKHAIFF